MYLLKTSLKSENLGELKEMEQRVLGVAPEAVTCIVKECERCKNQIEMIPQDLGPEYCPNCRQAW